MSSARDRAKWKSKLSDSKIMKIDGYKKENGWSLSAGGGDEPDFGEEHDVGLVTQEAEPELKRPPMYKVILLNDDYTPMEFVAHILSILRYEPRRRRRLCLLSTQKAARLWAYFRGILRKRNRSR